MCSLTTLAVCTKRCGSNIWPFVGTPLGTALPCSHCTVGVLGSAMHALHWPWFVVALGATWMQARVRDTHEIP